MITDQHHAQRSGNSGKQTVRSPGFSRPDRGGKNDREIPQKPEDFQPGGRRRRGLFHSKRQGQDHGFIRAWQGSGGRDFRGGGDFGGGAVFRRGLPRG